MTMRTDDRLWCCCWYIRDDNKKKTTQVFILVQVGLMHSIFTPFKVIILVHEENRNIVVELDVM